MCKFSDSTKEKLGNALIYVAERVQDLSKTKALKLLYLMEERMVLRYHVPFLGIPFEVWQAGPVAKDVFIDLSDGPYLLKDYIKAEFRPVGYVSSAPLGVSADLQSAVKKCPNLFVLRGFEIPILRGRTILMPDNISGRTPE